MWPVAGDTFFRVADYWLVGHALADGHTVVSPEVPAVSTKRIKIPNAGVDLRVPCMSPFEMLRLERVRFILEPGLPHSPEANLTINETS